MMTRPEMTTDQREMAEWLHDLFRDVAVIEGRKWPNDEDTETMAGLMAAIWGKIGEPDDET